MKINGKHIGATEVFLVIWTLAVGVIGTALFFITFKHYLC